MYRGVQLATGRKVALKLLHPEMTADENLVARFRREGLVLCNLRDAHTITTYDFDQTSDGTLYIAMELLEGKSLHEVFHANPPLEWRRVLRILAAMCSSLAEAHSQGIVHRDLKPANLFVTPSVDGQPHIKLLDFGVASAPTGNTQITQTGIIMGTPAFMCPEQMRSSRHPEPRWDIWSLGVALYQCLEGAQPFAGDGFAELVLAVVTQAPRPAQQIEPDLLAVVERCLHKEPMQRYQNVHEVAIALAPFASNPVQAQTSINRTARFLGLPSSSAKAPSTPPRATRRWSSR